MICFENAGKKSPSLYQLLDLFVHEKVLVLQFCDYNCTYWLIRLYTRDEVTKMDFLL